MKENKYLVKDGKVVIETDFYLGESHKKNHFVVPPRVMQNYLESLSIEGGVDIPLSITKLNNQFELEEIEVGRVKDIVIGNRFNLILTAEISSKKSFYEFLFTDERLVNVINDTHKVSWSFNGDFTFTDNIILEISRIKNFVIRREVDLKIKEMQKFFKLMPDELSISETNVIDDALGKAREILETKFYR